MERRSTYVIVAAMLSVAIGEKCGYVRGPLAATNDTVVVNLDCKQATPSSRYVPLQLRDNATHVAIQLVHCHTVPVGLFTNVTDSLTSLTIASEDAVQLLERTFEGLGNLTELRLLGFAKLKNLSTALLEPLRNIQTLILDGFGRDNIELPYLGSVIQKLSGTPIRRLVLHTIKDNVFFQQIMQVDDFHISNASLKELIITDVAFSYIGSIRRAFPELTCYCAEGRMDGQIAEAFPAVFDLTFLSERLKELVISRPKHLSALQTHANIPFTQFVPSLLKAGNLYPDLVQYLHSRTVSDLCSLGFKFSLGENLSKLTVNGFLLNLETEKPICVQKDNNLTYMDLTRSHVSEIMPLLIGFDQLHYLILENAGIKKFPEKFLKYYPTLKMLQLSKLDLGDFLKNSKGDFFGSCPTLADILLDNCNVSKIPTTLFSQSINLQYLDMSNNYLRTFDLDLQNCTKLNVLNFSRNNIESISDNHTIRLTYLALRKTGGNNLVFDLTDNRFHCLCNSTHFVKWLQRSPTKSNIKFPGFDSYTCLYPNGSIVRVSEVIVSELEQQCSVIQTLVNGSDCPCDEELGRRIQQVRMSLDGFFCRNDDGDLVAMNSQLPSCFNPFLRASFIAPVTVGGILGITVFITVGLLIYYRNSRRVRQVRDCLAMNPVHFVRTALEYVIIHNREEEPAHFRHNMYVFVQKDDQASIHGHFLEALQGDMSVITQDNIRPGMIELDKVVQYIDECRWIVPVITPNFLSDTFCRDFISRIQKRRHAVIPVVWEQPSDVTDVSIRQLLVTGDVALVPTKHLLETGEPLYWPGNEAARQDVQKFWSALRGRTIPLP